MRPWFMAVGAIVVAAGALECTPPPPGTLVIEPRPKRIFDDGDPTTLTFTALDAKGNIGKGTVAVQALHGALGQTSLTIDSYGTAKTTFGCDVSLDPACSGSVAVTATWLDARAELAIPVDERCPGSTLCAGACVVTTNDWHNCGACGVRCGNTESCVDSACGPCPGADCDGDGWTPANGDCCDQFNVCSKPSGVNPGALEAPNNGLDDNCNGLVDAADREDLESCDTNLGPRANDAIEFARTLGLCRMAVEFPPLAQKTWGLISAELLTADGDAGVSPNSASIRPIYGTLPPLEGSRLAVFSSGAAADSVQTDPSLSSGKTGTSVSIRNCSAPGCIDDWFLAGNPPLKLPGKLPGAPVCAGGDQDVANDSVMLRLRIRAPTNAGSFSVHTRFFSEEYPEFVCSAFNDQVILLIDTPGVTGLRNPIDKNLMTYTSSGGSWPIGINLATGTPLFQSCESQSANPSCWDTNVNVSSCGLGPGDLAKTQFSAPDAGGCVRGGGTKWLVTSGNVKPGEIFELRAAVWNVSDHILDSLFLMDDFRWRVDAGEPGTGEEAP